MRKIGGHVSTAGGLTNAILNTKKIDGNCMQIFAGSPRSWARQMYEDKATREFRELIKKENLNPVFIHALYLINLTADSAQTLEKSVTALESELKTSVLIGSAGVILHIGSYTTRSFDEVKDALVNQIDRILTKVPAATLILENSAGQKGKIGTLEELGFLVKKLDNERVKICLDTAHLFAAGYDFRTKSGMEALLMEIEENNLFPQLRCIHLNDSVTKCDSRRDVHANLGKGEIGLEGLRLFVTNEKLKNLPVILEVPGDASTKSKGPDKINIEIAKSLCA